MFRTFALILCFLCLGSFATEDVFRNDYESYLAGKTLTEAISSNAQRFSFSMVVGMGELSPRFSKYFQFVENELIEQGITVVSILRPSDRKSVEDNAAVLLQQWKAIVERTGKPLVVLGHSMGAVIALVAAFLDPEWSRIWIKRVYGLGGPVEGADLADYTYGIKRDEWGNLTLRVRLAMDVTSFFLIRVMRFGPALESLTVQASHDRLNALIDSDPQMVQRILENQVLFIRSSIDPSRRVSWVHRAPRSFLDQAFPDDVNDSMVPRRRQAWEHASARVTTISNYSHLDVLGNVLFCPLLISEYKERLAKNIALTRAILEDLYRN